MSNEFDIEKAKAGEPVIYRASQGQWVKARFHNTSAGGRYLVIEHSLGEGMWKLAYAEKHELSMAPKTVKVRYRNYKMGARHAGVSVICDSPGWHTPEEIEKKHGFRGWIHTDWQEVEIPQ